MYIWLQNAHTAHFLGPGMVGRGVLRHSMVACAWAWAQVCKYNYMYYAVLHSQELMSAVSLWPKHHKISHKVSKITGCAVVPQPCYKLTMNVKEVTVLKPCCSQSNVSAGQRARDTGGGTIVLRRGSEPLGQVWAHRKETMLHHDIRPCSSHWTEECHIWHL